MSTSSTVYLMLAFGGTLPGTPFYPKASSGGTVRVAIMPFYINIIELKSPFGSFSAPSTILRGSPRNELSKIRPVSITSAS
jgi:hypothetical protein